MIKKFLRQALISNLAVISQDSALKKDKSHCPQVFLKECKHIDKKLIRHINDNLSDISYSDESGEEQVKTIKLMIFENVFFVGGIFNGAILKKSNEE